MAADITLQILAETKEALAGIEKFSKQSSKAFSGIESAVGGLNIALRSIVGLAAAAGVAFSFKEAISEAAHAEEAVNKLNTALALSGSNVDGASKKFQELAKSIQISTKFSDEQALSAITVAKNFNVSNKDVEKFTKASVELATVLGTDLNSAALILGKTLQGNSRGLKEAGINVKDFSEKALRSGAAIDFINQRFAGAASGEIKTFTGALAQNKNALSEVLEKIGDLIIKNPLVIRGITALSDAFIKFAKFLENNLDTGIATFNSVLGDSLIVIGEVLSKFSVLIKILSFVVTAYFIASQAILDFIQTTAAIRAVFDTTFAVVGRILSGFLFVIASVVENILKLIGVLSQTEFAQGIFKKLGINVDKFNTSLVTTVDNIDEIKNELAKATEGFDGSKITDSIVESNRAAKDLATKGMASVISSIDSASESSKKFGAQIKSVNKSVGELASIKSIEVIAKLKISQEEIDLIIKDPFQAVLDLNHGKFDDGIRRVEGRLVDVSKKFDAIVAISATLLAQILKGQEGAKNLVTTLVTGFLKALGPIGKALSQIIGPFLEGAASVTKFINEFFAAIPTLIQNLVEAIPAAILAVINNIAPLVIKLISETIPNLINALIAAIPEIIISFVDNLILKIPDIIKAIIFLIPTIINNLISQLPRLITALVSEMPRAVIALATGLIQEAPRIAIGFITAIVKEVPRIIGAIAEGIADALKNLLGGGKSGIPIIGGVVDAIGGLFGFAEGGQVPPGFPNDTFPARLSSGEFVINRTQNERFDRLLDQLEQNNGRPNIGGGAQNVTINLQVGEQQLANVLLSLNQRGFRTA